MSSQRPPLSQPYRKLAACLVGLLATCGCGGDPGSNLTFQPGSGPAADSSTSLKSEPAQSTTGLLVFESQEASISSAVLAEPTYHLAPVFPPEPLPVDASGDSVSADLAPQVSLIPKTLEGEPTLRLKVDQLGVSAEADNQPAGLTPKTAVTYSPAQIRAAYGLPPVPSSLSGLTAAQAAQLGAGQTIYVIDAYHDFCAYNELAAFSQLFGLPACANSSLAPTASLPLAAASNSSASFYQVYATTSGGMTPTAPAYDPNWAVETALDVQWAHAIAPLARIVLIEAPDASMAGMTGAIQLANRMGPGVVSMSFGASEASYVTSLDSYFKTTGMGYFAATGDNGAGVSWPAVAPNVVAVGGTSLSYSGSGARSETVWSGTGGGVSAYEARPAYQASTVPGMGAPARRSVADVAFNADPSTGQYVAVVRNQTASTGNPPVTWVTAGGTSLSTPQWAALTAVTNAMRVQAGKTVLGDAHGSLYTDLASYSATYAASFLDVIQGNNGTGAANTAHAGYDAPTGLGTPNGLTFLTNLSRVSGASAPPVVTGASVNGLVGTPLTFTGAVSDPNPYTLSLSGAPGGMTVNAAGLVSWPAPVLGTYSVTLIAKDSLTGLTGQGVYRVQVDNPPPPVVTDSSATTSAGAALNFRVSVSASNPYTLSLAGAPAGMTISSAGTVNWPSPVAGSYVLKVTAKDNLTGLSGQGTCMVVVYSGSNAPPMLSSGSFVAKTGTALRFTVVLNDPNACTFTLSGAPAGMTVNNSGLVSWTAPVAGNYNLQVIARDSKNGLSGQGSYLISVGGAAGPVITSTSMLGQVGQALNATLSLTNGGAGLSSVGVAGGPVGMTFAPQAGGLNNLTASWPAPVAGNYLVSVQASDSAGSKAQAWIPITIRK